MNKITISTTTGKTGRRVITGQGMTEYIIIVALIAIASIGAVSFFGDTVQGAFAGLSTSLAGGDMTEARTAMDEASEKAVATAKKESTLGDYENN